MPEFDPVILQLIADVKKYTVDVQNATRLVDQRLGQQGRSVQKLEQQFKSSSGRIGATIRGLAGAFATAFSARELAGFSDGFTRLQNNLRVSGLEGEKLAGVQSNLLDISQRYGASVESLSGVFMKASMAQKELGASTQQIVQLNEVIAAALKVTGTSAQEASGALLQLGQALSSGVVRAEEFNSLLEGAYPLVQAAARGIDRFGGSVAKLRVAVTEGKVSSREFFEGVLKGGVETIKQAESATMTLSGAFEALKSSLTVYIGEADKANGVSMAVAGAIKSIADNLDILIPALASIAVGLGSRYVAGAIAATVATRGLTASMALLAGNPLTLAIGALAAGFTYLALTAKEAGGEAEQTLRDIRKAADDAEKALAKVGEGGKKAKDGLDQAKDSAAALKKELFGVRGEALLAANALAKQRLNEAQAALDRRQNQDTRTPFSRMMGAQKGGTRADGVELSRLADRVEAARRDFQLTEDALNEAAAAATEAWLEGLNPPAPAGTDPKKDKKKKGPTEAELSARHFQEMSRLRMEELSAQLDLVTSAEERARLQQALIDEEYRARKADILADEHLTKARRDEQLKALEALYRNGGLYAQAVNREKREQLDKEALDIATARNENDRDLLAADRQLADGREERRAIELRLLDLAYDQERAELEAVLASVAATDAQKQIAAERLRILDRLKARDTEAVNREYESPLERYRREIERNAGNRGDLIEQSAVDALDAFNDGLADAIANSKSLGDVFKNVSKQIIADLIRIAIQQTVVNSLMKGISSLFGGGFVNNSVNAFNQNFAASGTNFAHGGIYRVGESGPETVVLPRGAKVLPATQTAAMGRNTQPTQIIVRIDSSPYFDATVDQRAAGVAAPMAVASGLESSRQAQQSIMRRSRNRIP